MSIPSCISNISAKGEWIGYIGRAISAKDQWDLGTYIFQSILPLITPTLFATSVYMVLGLLIVVIYGEKHSVIAKKWLTKIFFTRDSLSLIS